MKLARFGAKGEEKPGIVGPDGTLRDATSLASDWVGETVSLTALERLRRADLAALPVVAGNPRLGPCLADAPNIFCIGLNYAKHAAETGAAAPTEPILFMKATSAINGPTDPIVIPKGSEKTDWEAELGVVIGRETAYVSEAEALGAVAGYCAFNDVSERDWQKNRGGTWCKGKSAPGFAPMGPYLVTADAVPNPQALSVEMRLNGAVRQRSSTDDMIFSVAHIISYLSQFLTLRPGDVIATGTPEGVGAGMKPPRFLAPGDVVEIAVEGLGAHRNVVAAYGG